MHCGVASHPRQHLRVYHVYHVSYPFYYYVCCHLDKFCYFFCYRLRFYFFLPIRWTPIQRARRCGRSGMRRVWRHSIRCDDSHRSACGRERVCDRMLVRCWWHRKYGVPIIFLFTLQFRCVGSLLTTPTACVRAIHVLLLFYLFKSNADMGLCLVGLLPLRSRLHSTA